MYCILTASVHVVRAILVHHLEAGFCPLILTRGEQTKHVLKCALSMAIYEKL